MKYPPPFETRNRQPPEISCNQASKPAQLGGKIPNLATLTLGIIIMNLGIGTLEKRLAVDNWCLMQEQITCKETPI